MRSLAQRVLMGPIIAALGSACASDVLDLGRNDPTIPTRYATPETIAAERDAGPGVATEIASHRDGAVALAVDDERVYWSQELESESLPPAVSRGLVRSCVKDNCAATVIVYATGQVHARYLAVNKTSVFWNSYQRIFSCPINGCLQPPTTVSTVGFLDFVADDSDVYVLTGAQTIVRCPVEGCQGEPTIVASLAQGFAPDSRAAFAMDATNLYWIEGESSSSTSRTIMTVPKDGSAPPHALGEGGHLVNSIASNGTQLFWAESHQLATVKGCGLSRCSQEPITLASPQRYPHLLTLSGGFAYWFVATAGDASISWPPGHLVECPLAGCGSTPTVIISDQANPTDLAVDSTHLYWTLFEFSSDPDKNAGAVKRIRRSR